MDALQEAIAELDSLLCLVESQAVPGSPNSPKNEKLEKALQHDVADYFKSLEAAFPYDSLANLYLKRVKQE